MASADVVFISASNVRGHGMYNYADNVCLIIGTYTTAVQWHHHYITEEWSKLYSMLYAGYADICHRLHYDITM